MAPRIDWLKETFYRRLVAGATVELAYKDDLIASQISRPKYQDPTVEAIATEFSSVIRQWSRHDWCVHRHGTGVFRRIQEANRADRDPRGCHSHDFMDANMAMDKAMRTVLDSRSPPAEGLRHPPQPGRWVRGRYVGPDYVVMEDWIWNLAWSVAKNRGFEREHVEVWPIVRWMKRPTFGTDPVTGEIRPTPDELPRILVALDRYMENQ